MNFCPNLILEVDKSFVAQSVEVSRPSRVQVERNCVLARVLITQNRLRSLAGNILEIEVIVLPSTRAM